MGGVDKSALTRDGVSLLARTCYALDAATSIVVVGHSTAIDVPARVKFALEDPPFGGPAAGIGAGLHALEESAEPLVVVLACDLPYVDRALPHVLATPISAASDGVMVVDEDGRRQTLLGLYRRAALVSAAMTLGSLTGVAVRALVAGLILEEIALPNEALRDVDRWADARELGVEGGTDGT
ncbi:molybdenum cofactor guanylyltransferase [soil metagenome]